MCLLGVFAEYYNNYRYANYTPGQHENNLRKLFIGFLRKLNGKQAVQPSEQRGNAEAEADPFLPDESGDGCLPRHEP